MNDEYPEVTQGSVWAREAREMCNNLTEEQREEHAAKARAIIKMSTPIPPILSAVEWKEEPMPEQNDSDLPYATHSGVLNLFGHELRCFRLSDGKAIFHADDFEKFMEDWLQ